MIHRTLVPRPGRRSRCLEDFDDSYVGTPAWDIGRPQSLFIALADEGAVKGRVLDAGCGGRGETHRWPDISEGWKPPVSTPQSRAIEMAKGKAIERGVTARFLVWDALALAYST